MKSLPDPITLPFVSETHFLLGGTIRSQTMLDAWSGNEVIVWEAQKQRTFATHFPRNYNNDMVHPGMNFQERMLCIVTKTS